MFPPLSRMTWLAAKVPRVSDIKVQAHEAHDGGNGGNSCKVLAAENKVASYCFKLWRQATYHHHHPVGNSLGLGWNSSASAFHRCRYRANKKKEVRQPPSPHLHFPIQVIYVHIVQRIPEGRYVRHWKMYWKF